MNNRITNDMTKEEKHLWNDFLKELPYEVRKKSLIGKYNVDFYIPSSKIVIEIKKSRYDEEESERDSYFKELGIKVFKYSAFDINSRFYSICNDIMCCIINTNGL